MADFSVRNEGSIYLFTPEGDAAEEFAEVAFSDAMSFGGAYVVEHRYA